MMSFYNKTLCVVCIKTELFNPDLFFFHILLFLSIFICECSEICSVFGCFLYECYVYAMLTRIMEP